MGAYAQEFKEAVQPLSAKAVKGYMYEAKKDKDGNSIITYKIAGPKKTKEVFYEQHD